MSDQQKAPFTGGEIVRHTGTGTVGLIHGASFCIDRKTSEITGWYIEIDWPGGASHYLTNNPADAQVLSRLEKVNLPLSDPRVAALIRPFLPKRTTPEDLEKLIADIEGGRI